MNLFAIPPHLPFLETLAAGWLAECGGDPQAVSRGLILLPTRRAARALAEAFLRQAGGRPLLLPRITAFGALDEAPLALAGALTLPPAVEQAQRLAVLSRFILALNGDFGAPRSADRAWRLAAELASLVDEAHRAGVDLAAALPGLADQGYAEHWEQTLRFLDIVTRQWPAWLAEQGLMDPAARQAALLRAQRDAWERTPPEEPVLVAGTTAGMPGEAELLRVVAGMPSGRVLLAGIDRALPEAVWSDLPSGHPQAGLRDLLLRLGARRDDVRLWPAQPGIGRAAPVGREVLLGRALLPAGALESWRTERFRPDTEGLLRLQTADQQEEAVAIAMVLRDALERPGAHAALVTPDRALAARVSAELLRYGVVADDSAGEPLAETPPAVFLRLLAEAVVENLAPVPLLALLKHPLTAAGLHPAAAREAARALELACLRGPRPGAGLAGLRQAVDRATTSPAVRDLLDRLEHRLEPLLRLTSAVVVPPADALAVLVRAAEALAGTADETGPARLWALEEGEALATCLSAVQDALPMLPEEAPRCLPGLLDAVLEGAVVRSRRALRGRSGTEHPRVFIWGLLEARLQSADVIVLGGLAEGVWPPATDPGPWMSRPMRARAGLPSPEERVGQAAHDFTTACCAAPVAVLSCPRRRDGAPAVPSRWLTRLDACLAGEGARLGLHSAAAWARALDQPDGGPRPVAPPRPCPAVTLRPRKLSVTEIETWLRDPYAIYARHVLRLVPLDPVEQSADAASYGALVHAALHRFLGGIGPRWPADARERLRAAMELELRQAGVRPAVEAWWMPRLHRIADWVAEEEARRRAEAPPAFLQAEVSGRWTLDVPDGFTLTGRADRIERRADGTLSLLDYKTGTVPAQKDVDQGRAPQLPLEAAMAANGAFGPELAGQAAELTYWKLSGGHEPGRAVALFRRDAQKVAALAAVAANALRDLVVCFDDPARAYLAQPHPGHAPRFSRYAQLARVHEWGEAAEDE
ncbi:MAG: double-strand break repair protein AddB [Acidisphaera sp.]|nr:double-strand break repair protein AddB [Acidisphaera sp.]